MRDAWVVAFVALAVAVTLTTLLDRARLPLWLYDALRFLAPCLVVVALGGVVWGVLTW